MDLDSQSPLAPPSKKAKKEPEPEPFKGIHLQEFFENMKEGEEFECTDFYTEKHYHFIKWDGELWQRGWDDYLGDFRWFLFKIVPPSSVASGSQGVEKAPE